MMQYPKYDQNNVACICMLLNGKIRSCPFNPSDLDKNKYSLISLTLNNHSLLVIYNFNIYIKINKIATEITGKEVRGPIVFMLLNDSFIPINMLVSQFKLLVYTQINYKQINIRKLLLLFEIFTKYVNKDISHLIYATYFNILRNPTK